MFANVTEQEQESSQEPNVGDLGPAANAGIAAIVGFLMGIAVGLAWHWK